MLFIISYETIAALFSFFRDYAEVKALAIITKGFGIVLFPIFLYLVLSLSPLRNVLEI